VFRRVPGVIRAESGYSGGTTRSPTYEEVCSHTTGHAEAVQVSLETSAITAAWATGHPLARTRCPSRVHPKGVSFAQGWATRASFRSELLLSPEPCQEALMSTTLVGSTARSGVRRRPGSHSRMADPTPTSPIEEPAGGAPAPSLPTVRLVHLPHHASWLNQIEIYFSIVQRRCSRRMTRLTRRGCRAPARLPASVRGDRQSVPMEVHPG
jgi:hypothetical protein